MSDVLSLIYYIPCIIPLIAVTYIFLDVLGIVGPRRIPNLPMVPHWPIVGNMFDTLNNPCLKYIQWSSQHGDVFQVRMGNRIVVVANSFDSIRNLWIKNCVANNSRPELYTFHQVLSRGAVYTIGTTPFGSAYKRKRKYISTHLHRKMIDTYTDLISDEASATMLRILSHRDEGEEISLLRWVQYFSLRISLQLTYSYTIDVDHGEKELADEIIHVENAIVHMRSHTSNFQDYLPISRFLSRAKNCRAQELSRRRSHYMDMLFQHAATKSCSGACLVQDVLCDNDREISTEDLRSICLTMVSAGLDNTALNFDHCIGQLAANERIRDTALREILRCYGTPLEAWTHSGDLSCDYLVAILRETLRYFTVLPLCLPRATTKDIIYKNCVIPAGTILFMNAYAGNHDKTYFPDPHVFWPERYLDQELHLLESYNSNNGRRNNCQQQQQQQTHGIPSFSFGVGSRMCAGNHLAFSEMYTLLVKFLVLFDVAESADEKSRMELDPIKANKDPSSVAIEPREFKVRVTVRDNELLKTIQAQA